MPTVPSQNRRLPSLDGLRGISIIFVLWGHASATRGFSLVWSADGQLGVRIFFVISGFIITWLMIQEENTRASVSLSSFYRRRAVRILPVYWCYLLVVALLGYCRFFPFKVIPDLLQPLTFSLGLSFWGKKIAWQTAHTWSLAIEEQFYLIWPLAFVLLQKRLRVFLPIIVVIIGPFARCWIWFHPTYPTLSFTIVAHGDMLAWGCLLAIGLADYPALMNKIVSWRPMIARLIALVAIQFAPWYFSVAFAKKFPPLATTPLTQTVQAAAIAFLIASLTCIQSGVLYRLLNKPVIVWIGLLSYSLYLWQQIFLSNDGLHAWSTWPTNMVCAFAAAIASYFLIESPFRNAFGRRKHRQPVADPMLVVG